MTGRPQSPADLVFFGAKSDADLRRLKDLKTWIEPNGAIWVIRPKGGRSEISDIDVISAGLAAGLVDNKIAAFSTRLTSIRFVIPVARRRQASGVRREA